VIEPRERPAQKMADKQTKQAATDSSKSRTTSETLRLEAKGPKKGPSFQITSVTRVSTDAGDDSADDLDESRDTESRATDLETPSFSEDTSFSRDDIFAAFGQGAAVAAPVIPTSAQYGLALVASGASSDHPHGPNEAKEADQKDQPCRNDRFKVLSPHT
jgi:hypothetical protein